ncbi:MAG: PEGA domain-containing protein, partial [Spirochaetaceae bacterium]
MEQDHRTTGWRNRNMNISGQKYRTGTTVAISNHACSDRLFFAIACALSCILVFSSCAYSYKIKTEPSDSQIVVNGESIITGAEYKTGDQIIKIRASAEGCLDHESEATLDLFSLREITVTLEKKKYEVTIRAIPENLLVSVDRSSAGKSPFQTTLTYGNHSVTLLDRGNMAFETSIFVMAATSIPVRVPARTEKVYPTLNPSLAISCGLFPTGSQPKQVIFTRDSRFLYIPLLDDPGFDIFRMDSFRREQLVQAGNVPAQIGFPEGLFLENKNRFLITQMTRNVIIEYDCSDFARPVMLREFGSGGVMPKIIVFSDELDIIAVSNWESNSVAIIDYKTGNIIKTITGIPVPRGLLFSPDSGI